MSKETFQQMYDRATPEVRQLCDLLIGNLSDDDLVISRIIANLAVDACGGKKDESKALLEAIGQQFPALNRLFARVGYQINMARNASKH